MRARACVCVCVCVCVGCVCVWCVCVCVCVCNKETRNALLVIDFVVPLQTPAPQQHNSVRNKRDRRTVSENL